jgi:hypothetical protein
VSEGPPSLRKALALGDRSIAVLRSKSVLVLAQRLLHLRVIPPSKRDPVLLRQARDTGDIVG